MTDEEFMDEAVRIAVRNVSEGGGPFGAVIVKDGKIVARGVNRVTANLDPTAHAEVQAIRSACRALGSFSLEGGHPLYILRALPYVPERGLLGED